VAGRRDRVVISATQGLGDRLVAGEVDGSGWWLARPALEVVATTGDGEGLTPEQVREVAELCLAASVHGLAPLHLPRRPTRPVSYYAFFK